MADSNRNVKIVAVTLALLLLLGGAGAVVVTNEDDEDKDKPGPGKCPKGYHWAPGKGKCMPIDPFPGNVDPGGGKIDPGTGACPAGMIKNAARLKALATGKKGAELEAELAKYPECVPIQCPKDHHRTAYGDCEPECPPGYQWSIVQGKCVQHTENCPPGEQWSPTLLRCVKTTPTPTDNDDPKDIPSIIKDFPEGANFYQVRHGDTFEGATVAAGHVAIAHAYLQREAFLAARDVGGLDNAAAMAWAKNVAKPYKAYMAAFEIILCGGTNDACYGTYGYCGKRGKTAGVKECQTIQNHPGAHGRAIQLDPKHPNNRSRLLNGQNLARGVTLGNPARSGDGLSHRVEASFDSLPLLWMPLLNRAALWQSKGKTIEISTETWSDNTTKGWPPPIVMDRYLSDYADTGRKAWGCMKMELEGE